MTRAFIALPISSYSRSFFKDLQKVLPPNLKLSPDTNFHLTLAFLGPISDSKIPLIKQIVKANQPKKPLALTVNRLSAFPKPKRAKIFYASISGPDLNRLYRLVSSLKRALKSQKISFDPKPFKAHLTLARSKTSQKFTLTPVKPTVSVSFGRITLLSSITSQNFPVYQKL